MNDTRIGLLPREWKLVQLKQAIIYDHKSINPLNFPDEEFEYYSIPAYAKYRKPILEFGKAILSQKLVVENETVLFGKLNPRVPKIWLVNSQVNRRRISSTEFIPLRYRDGISDAEYIYFLVLSRFILPKSQELVSGSTPSRQRVDISAFLDIPIPLPPINEQRAIAHVLRIIRQSIESSERVIAASRELKLSLLKYLFSYGSVPLEEADKVAIQEHWFGTLPAKWALPQISDVTTELRNRNSDLLYGREDVLTVSNVDGFLPSDRSLGKDFTKYKIVSHKQFAYNPMRLNIGSIAFCRREQAGIVSPDYISLKCNEEDLLPEYFNQFRYTKMWEAQIQRSGQGSVRIRYYYHHIADFKIPLPTLKEQYIIAEVLDNTDKKIQAETQRKETIQTFFDTLLDHLMTGKFRVQF